MRRLKNSPEHDGPVNWHVLTRLWPYLLEHKIRVGLALACLILAKIASVGLPFVLKHIVDGLNIPADKLTTATFPIALIVAYGVVRLSNVLFGEIRDTLFGRVTERAMRRIGLSVFKHLHQLELAFHLNRQTGGLSRDIERGTTGISFLMRFMVFNIVPTLLEIVLVAAILLVNYGWGFGLIVLLSVIAYVAFSVKATDWRTRYVREMNKADSTTNTRAIDSLLNFETVRYFANEQYEARLYDDNLAQWETARRNNRLSLFALNGGQAFIIAASMTAMMLLAAHHVSEGTMTIGDFVLINAFTMQIFMPLNFLGFVYREIRNAMANIENLFTLLDTRPKVNDKVDATTLEVSQGAICFDKVKFQYQPERPILNEISFKVEAGQKVAIVGESGSGKSTISKLLFRLYDIDGGEISIDGQAIDAVTQQSLRQQLAIVPQDTVLFNDTIAANIRYGQPDASDEQLQQAIKLAHLGKFIDSLPDGLNTQVGERGLKLSGGEKQRVAIARAILKGCNIIVFDEATSSLDSHSEQAILEAIREVSSGHTSLIIAHRLSTIVDADCILVMQQGAIAEQGTHQQLLAKQGVYAALWQTQLKQHA
ncbi:ABCB family ABC transporter ATP-binding protein/permease [Neptunicella marina]|uniref:ABC transporter ATP-binding protein/permease n=1 Tax=Neptunicella marina TaxID=2125989 RepID=A0A8J6ITK1_9ALTE|nr:ABC transporter ATP-binding protein/permease [Neptunicella marina]MBC3767155.1 ABC transporter ATP-binding protein/permease [Neptunicella marina]